MKAATIYRAMNSRYPAYPNAADRRYFLRKFLDGLLTAFTVVGIVVAIVFLVVH